MAYVYILQSLRDNRYYIGSTTNLNSRLNHHRKGYTYSTKRFGGVRLVFFQKYEKLKEARSIEKKLKGLKRHDYLDKIVRDGFIRIRP